MELCTACIWTSAQWSHTLTPNRRASYHGFARSISLVPQRRRRSTLYVTNAASTSAPVSSQNITQLPRIKSISSDKPSSALEQLDIERGVCIPFRRYTPDMVPKSSCFSVLQVLANRPDIIREDYMNELCILQDDVPPVPNHVAFAIIEEELGQPLERLFSKISSGTIAAASLGQVYRATLRETGEDVAIKVQRPGIEPIIYRDLFLLRTLASFLNGICLQKLGCNAELIVDEFGEKLLEELDYTLEATNIENFLENLKDDPTVKIPRVYKQLSGSRVPVMEWIDGIRCTDPQAIKEARIDVEGFLTVGVSAALRQLLEFDLFHGDPHPGNIFAMRDGHISYVDFGNVAVLSQQNKQTLTDVVVHAVNEGYAEMANDFTRLGFLASGTDVAPIIPALEAIWQNSAGKGLADFNFRSVTGKFNQLVYNYPIRIPERFSLVIRSLLTQEGICFTLKPDFKFLERLHIYMLQSVC
uniref:Protein kinase domain-containing protein n=1 Tax=Setaria viridis TaxID=4556 RepID=A0A4V6D2X8_SETVI|nr:hypothetical protein SEVIR_8G097975v2 [Setaria viridis]